MGGRAGTAGEKKGEERREEGKGLAGCGLKWQQIVLDHSNPSNSTGKLQLVARWPHLRRKSFQTQAAGTEDVVTVPSAKRKRGRETTTLQLGYQ